MRILITAFSSQPRVLLPQRMKGPMGNLLEYILSKAPAEPAASLSPQVDSEADTVFTALQDVTPDAGRASPTVRYNVKISHRTTLAKVIFHPEGQLVDYPETSAHEFIGHVIPVSLDSDWINPVRNFAYSRGEPKGGERSNLRCPLLVDANGNEVPCYETHDTCECSYFVVLRIFRICSTITRPRVESMPLL